MKIEGRAGADADDRGARAANIASVTLFAVIDGALYEGLRAIAFAERRALSDVVGKALDAYVAQQAVRRRLLSSGR